MNLRTLRYFKAIADTGSFNAAAILVAIAQPALSRQMKDLESELGVSLLSRSKRGVRLTPAGVALYESAARMLDEEGRIRRNLSVKGGTRGRVVTLGISPTFSGVLLPGVFTRCFHNVEGIELVTREATSPHLAEALEKSTIDLAVLTNTAPTRAMSLQPLLSEPFALVGSVAEGLPSAVPLKRLGQRPLLMTPVNRRIVEQQLVGFGVSLDVHAELDSVAAIRELVAAGGWYTIMPVSAFKHEIGKRLKVAEIAGAQLHRSVSLGVRTQERSDSAVETVARLIRAEIERLTADGMFRFPGRRQ